jgi:hypothetical protein
MPTGDFRHYMDRAIDFGFDSFNLTPNVGEPLADPWFPDRLEYLENDEHVAEFFFSTNFTFVSRKLLTRLAALAKLRCLSISIYGLSEDAFARVTGGSPGLFARIADNLSCLPDYPGLLARTELKLRGVSAETTGASGLGPLVERLRQGGARVRTKTRFSNWAGEIDDAAIRRVGLQPKCPDLVRTEPCVFVFFGPALLVDGRVNLCSCGDGQGRLVIGSVKDAEWDELFSSQNARLTELIDRHVRVDFPEPCRNCSEYRPPSQDWHSYAYSRKRPITFEEYERWLGTSNL